MDVLSISQYITQYFTDLNFQTKCRNMRSLNIAILFTRLYFGYEVARCALKSS